jgi:hypothetical protein
MYLTELNNNGDQTTNCSALVTICTTKSQEGGKMKTKAAYSVKNHREGSDIMKQH